ncbi:hypothetical protein PFISCL1PPCAC_12516 [Pristionchus fissidentatus]|uniref:protein-serine/threonine phosphatase n=1 Tax=Pristionchus fissidentatus TaxID=1538716 RepID=A0AAV5VTY8_9BILA|nr:hypothetical protein PFISCL1PPCAC_12516 [Pristionchus fissidentatus]
MSFPCETALEALVRLGCPLGLSVGEAQLDSLLKPVLLPLKTVEICGDPGTGKSMLCYTLAVEALAARKDSIVFWLDSNGSFRESKLMEIYRTRRGAEEDVEESSVLTRVLVKRVYNDEELSAALHGVIALGEDDTTVPVAAVFIDSVAGAMEETSWTLRQGGRTRQETIVRQIGQLKKILGTTVVCTNRVVSAADGTLRAALGTYWNKTISRRLILIKTPSGTFEARHFPHERVTDDTVVQYTLGEYGNCRFWVSPRAFAAGNLLLLLVMSLLQVQRSPSPFPDDVESSADSEEWSSVDSPRSRSLSECFFAVRGAAIILPHSDAASPTSSRGCEIEAHLQLMVKQLRPIDTLKVAVRLQSPTTPPPTSTILLGMDYQNGQMTLGVVYRLTRDSQVSLVGDGAIRLCSGGPYGRPEHSLLFRPVSVQTMWYVFQSLHRSVEAERAAVPTRASSACGVSAVAAAVDHYHKRQGSPEVLCTLWQQSPADFEWVAELRADGLRGRDGNESSDQRVLRCELRQIMQSVDLEAVTTRDIKQQLAASTPTIDVDLHKEFVDREMLVILGQLEKPSQILSYLYLGSEWNASNWDELQANNVGYILNMTQEVDNFFPHRFVYKKIWVADEAGTPLLSHWNATNKFIKAAKKSGKAVLVHCKKGISRSSSTVIAYAMKEYGWTLEYALEFVKARRNCITPNEGFMEQLRIFDGALEASRNREMFTKDESSSSSSRTSRQESSSPVDHQQQQQSSSSSNNSQRVEPSSGGDAVKGIVRAFERGELSESPPRGPRFPLDIVTKRSSIQQIS